MSVFRSIRFKTLVLMTLCVSLLVGASVVVTSRIIESGFQNIENQKVQENLERLVDTYRFDLDNLATKLTDWSAWDDTYKFIQDKNQAFSTSNLAEATLVSIKIQAMVFVNNEAQVVAGVGEIPEELQSRIVKGNKLITFSDPLGVMKGLLMTREGPMMVVSRPIVSSQNQGPIRGAVIFGKFLDNAEIQSLADVAHLTVDIVPILAAGERGDLVKIRDHNFIEGYTLLKDIDNKPALALKITYPRDITRQGATSTRYFVYAAVFMGAVFLLILMVFLGQMLIDRIGFLSREVAKIGESGSLNQRVTVGRGSDEIDTLSENINGMLMKLESAQKAIHSEEAKVKTFIDIVSGIVVVLSKGGNILSINKKGAEFLGILPDDATGKNWVENFVQPQVKDQVAIMYTALAEGREIDKYAYFEIPVRTVAGREYWFSWYNSVVRDESGQVEAIVSHGEQVQAKS